MNNTDARKLMFSCIELGDKFKAEDIVSMDLTEISLIADYMIIFSATSQPHIKALADHIVRDIRKETGIHVITIDGKPESEWIAIDFGAVIVHIMSRQKRELYQLENLWADAKVTEHKKNLS